MFFYNKEKAGELGAISGMLGLYAASLSDGDPRRVCANNADGGAFYVYVCGRGDVTFPPSNYQE